MNLATTWLGLRLPHPLVVGASPICDHLDLVRRCEDAGAAAIVMHSLFEEQVEQQLWARDEVAARVETFAEAAGFFPEAGEYVLGPDAYLEQVRLLKRTVSVPVIGSLNGVTPSGWVHHAKLIQEAGADALELNVYAVAHDPALSSEDVEQGVVELVRAVSAEVTIPVAVKLSPFYTSLTNLALRIERAGARGLVLFNRFYQPDIDPEQLDVSLGLELSDSSELLLRLRWLALLSGRTGLSLAATGGVHSGLDALKAVMAGADCVQTVSAVLRHGPERLALIRAELAGWLEEHEYESLKQAQGSMSLARCPRPEHWERGNYLRILQGWSRTHLMKG